jgi:peptide/nickel transport system substrate-binding protein
MYKSKFTPIVLLVFLAILLIGACAAPAASPKATPEPAQTTPKSGGTLNLYVVMDVANMDPLVGATQPERAFSYLWGSRLVTWAGKDDEGLTLAPLMAKSIQVAPDGLSYTVNLKEGIRWQNIPPVNGREFTSEDVKYFFQHLLDPNFKTQYKGYVAAVDHVETPDKYTAKIMMKEPSPAFLEGMAGGGFAFQAREVIEQYKDYSKVVVGTGPFIYVPEEAVPGSRYVFKKNPDYFEKGKPYVDRVQVTVLKDEAAVLAAFRGGQLDRIMVGKTTADNVLKTVTGVTAMPKVAMIGSGLCFGIKANPDTWGKAKLRQAVMYAIDAEGLIQACVSGAGQRLGFLAPFMAEWGATPADKLWKRDVAKSKQLLAEAGFPNGLKTTLLQDLGRMDAWGGLAEPVAAMLKDVGIDAEIKPMDKATYSAALRSGKYDIATVFASTERPGDVDNSLYNQYFSTATYNRSQYNNPRVDELITLQRKAFATPDVRKQYVKEILQIVENDTPIVPCFYSWNFNIVQPWVKGWDQAGDGAFDLDFLRVKEVWINK